MLFRSKFIYSIPSENALKQLRARSIYIDFICENLCEEIINTLDLNKTVLLYNGGGHAYFILPNTEETKQKFDEVIREQNEWLLSNFREKLYVSSGYVECSSLDLLNKDMDSQQKDFSKINVFQKLYEELYDKTKTNNIRRYTFNQIRELNSLSHQGKQECSVCGMSIKSNTRCEFCNSLTMLGDRITSKNGYILATENLVKDNLNIKLYSKVYGNKYLQISDIEDEEDIVQSNIISKKKINFINSGNDDFENFQLANYYARNENFELKTFEDFEKESIGINRLAFFRADIDDLGKAFKEGFKRGEDYKYQTLSRFATLSRSLSRFFKMYINDFCTDKKFMLCHSFNRDKEKRDLTVIYSGGDDISVVGSYDEIIEFASDIYVTFKKYCSSTLTISAGIGLYKSSYPVSKMAFETGNLLKRSKKEVGKDSITLFNDTGEYTFKWKDFIYTNSKDEENVLSRLEFVKGYFTRKGNLKEYGGKSFIYKIIECLRKGRSGIVKLAYTLGRLLSGNDNEQDKAFVDSIYNSSKDYKKRKAYIMALTLYVYSIREN